jgi:acetyl esterase
LWLVCQNAARNERRSGRVSLVAGRDRPHAIAAVRDDGLETVEHSVSVDGGSIRVRVYRATGSQPHPVHLLVHAGAFCSGRPQDVDALARRYAVRAQCAVVVVGYRLAPEHPWPAAPEDTYAALVWTVEHADELGLDPGRVSIGGISAGGCIAASVALMARDRGGPVLVFQLLEIPITDLTMSCPSIDRFGTGHLLTRADLVEAYGHYVPDPAQRRAASPLHAADLTGLPPTMVLTAEFDPLRDEGEAYARRLRSAGVAVQAVRASGHVHSSTYSALRSAERYRQITAAALARAFAASGTG